MPANRVFDFLAANVTGGSDAAWASEEAVACDAEISKTTKSAPIEIRVRTTSPRQAVAQLCEAFRLSELERKVSELMREVAELKEPKSHRPVAAGGSDPAIADVLIATHELFPGKVRVELTYDPADPDVDIVVFNVEGSGEFDDLIEKEIEWGNRITALASRHSGQLRLNVVTAK